MDKKEISIPDLRRGQKPEQAAPPPRDREEEEFYEEEEQSAPAKNGAAQEERSALRALTAAPGLLRVMLAGLIILAVIMIYAMVKTNRVYTSFEVVSSYARGEDSSAGFELIRQGIVKYSNNGISLMNQAGTELWNQTYEMTSPVMVSNNHYIAVGDRGANNIYIIDEYGSCSKMTTDVPIQELRISDQGVTAAILSDSESNYINMYSKDGQELVSIKATLGKTGYPLALALSPDARRLVVSYLNIDSGRPSSKIVFYSFEDKASDHVLYEKDVDGICPKVEFLTQNRAAVFGEDACTIYALDMQVSAVKDITFKDEIRSVFTGDKQIGFVLRNNDDKGKYRVEFYNLAGENILSSYLDLDYTQLHAGSEDIVFSSSQEAVAMRYDGKIRFKAKFENRAVQVLPSWEAGVYWVVYPRQIDEIRVR